MANRSDPEIQRAKLMEALLGASRDQLSAAIISLLAQCTREDTSRGWFIRGSLRPESTLYTTEIYHLLRRGLEAGHIWDDSRKIWTGRIEHRLIQDEDVVEHV